jgi:hypothetical protein
MTRIGAAVGVCLSCVFFVVSVAVAAPASSASPPSVEGACREVPEAENHLAILLSPTDVLRVEALSPRAHLADPSVPEGEGARITVAAQPFVTSAWLRDAIGCHVARVAAGKTASAPRSPLDVKGAKIVVTASPGVLMVSIASPDHRAAQEILARSRVLAPPAR